MKKYTVKDNLGNKKTVYAKNLAHALTFVDSNIKDDLDADIYNALVEVSKNKNTHSSFGWNGIIEGMVENILIKNGSIDKKDRFKVRKQIQQQMKESKVQKLFKDSIKDDSEYLGIVKINGRPMYIIHKKSVGMPEFWGITPDKWGDNPKKKFRSKEELDKYLKSVGATSGSKNPGFWGDSRIDDEANLPTTLQALVNDEEAAIKAYEVAIKNLEGKIDETQMQVLINIMKDERRHIENLYAILNGQVTEKNLEDSIHDGVNEARKLVESAGFKVKRAYGNDNEPYITVDWNGSYSELQRKVRSLKSEAKKIGYRDVYADDDDICFSKY